MDGRPDASTALVHEGQSEFSVPPAPGSDGLFLHGRKEGGAAHPKLICGSLGQGGESVTSAVLREGLVPPALFYNDLCAGGVILQFMKILFVTTNKYKFAEMSELMEEFGIELEQLNLKYAEDQDDSMEEIVQKAAQELASTWKRPVVLEDTGFFLDAYPGFPGPMAKFVYNTLGPDGILKFLEGKSRGAEFKTVVGYCEPGSKPVLFEGVLKGEVAEAVHNRDKDVFDYDRLFIPEGEAVTLSDMTMQEKNEVSQRAEAFRKFGAYITTASGVV